MRIGILTHYDVNNQGAQLQMYALANKVKELGHEPIILTYNKNFDFAEDKKFKYQPSIKSIPIYINDYLLKMGLKSAIHNYEKLKLNKKFRKENFKFQNYVNSDIDMAIVGSDEVFSIQVGINIMMYGYAVNTKKMISYAPSFGQTNIELLENKHVKSLVANGLKNFVALSSRDENTYQMIEKLTGRTLKMVCDPAILYDFKKEEIENTIKIPKKDYMVIYAYDHNMTDKNEIEAIKKYAKENNLQIISPGTYHKWCDKNISCNALQWVEIIKNAKCVVTDTFHGTIVSTITNVPMAVLIRNTLNSNKMTDLLKKLGIEDRQLNLINIKELNRVFENKINFENINHNIYKLRESSSEYLRKAISECEE